MQLSHHASSPASFYGAPAPRPAAPAPAGMSGAPTAGGSSPVDAMTHALESERRFVVELTSVMRRQREAVAADDLQALDDSVFATHRVLQTLGEAKKRRKSIVRLLGAPDNLNLTELEDALGPRMTPALGAARDALRDAAADLSREVAVNRDVLRVAMASGDVYMKMLTGNDTAAPVYGNPTTPASAPAAPTRGGILVDRRA